MMDDAPDVATVFELVARIRPILAHHHPQEQGAALAELLSLWLCGHPEAMRVRLLALHIMSVDRLNKINAEAPNANSS